MLNLFRNKEESGLSWRQEKEIQDDTGEMSQALEIYEELVKTGRIKRIVVAKNYNEMLDRAKAICAEVKIEMEAKGTKASEEFEQNFTKELDDKWTQRRFGAFA